MYALYKWCAITLSIQRSHIVVGVLSEVQCENAMPNSEPSGSTLASDQRFSGVLPQSVLAGAVLRHTSKRSQKFAPGRANPLAMRVRGVAEYILKGEDGPAQPVAPPSQRFSTPVF